MVEENSENSSCLKIRGGGELEDRRWGKMKEWDSVSHINSSSEMDVPCSPASVKKISWKPLFYFIFDVVFYGQSYRMKYWDH